MDQLTGTPPPAASRASRPHRPVRQVPPRPRGIVRFLPLPHGGFIGVERVRVESLALEVGCELLDECVMLVVVNVDIASVLNRARRTEGHEYPVNAPESNGHHATGPSASRSCSSSAAWTALTIATTPRGERPIGPSMRWCAVPKEISTTRRPASGISPSPPGSVDPLAASSWRPRSYPRAQ